jgi:hypothetical protein
MKARWLYTTLLFILPLVVCGQVNTENEYIPDSVFTGPDSMWHENLETINVYPRSKRQYRRYRRKYSQLAKKIKKVYPFAKLAAKKLEEYNNIYVTFETERERKRYIKKVEKDIFKEFGDKVRRLKISEGKILIKLIDREVGMSSFVIIKEFKGGFRAFFWQVMAKMFGNDLKVKYDPYKRDWMIEHIVWQIESGQI